MPGQYSLEEIKQGSIAVEETIKKAKELERIAISARRYQKIYTTGCGSSYWLAYLLADLLREGRKIDVQTVVASELYLEDYPESEKTLVIAFSQSGETTETIKALEQAKENKAKTLAIINQGRSTMSSLADMSFITPAGKEHIMATKSFDAALAASFILAKTFNHLSYADIKNVPRLYENILKQDIEHVALALKGAERAYAIGIDSDLGAAGETAVKLGESALLQTTALPALEISHGPKAHVDSIPVILIGMQLKFRKLYQSLVTELKRAGAYIISYSPLSLPYHTHLNVELPGTPEIAMFASIKLSQRIAVATAIAKGLDPDNPPTLKKFVRRDDL